MEAMALGSVCIVSDSGGQAEMIEDGRSGVVFPAGSTSGLAEAIRSVLRSPSSSDRLRVAAVRRISEITSPEQLVDRKIRHYDQVIRHARRRVGPTRSRSSSRVLMTTGLNQDSNQVPARGVVLLDAVGANEQAIAITSESVLSQCGSSPGWQLVILSELRREEGAAPSGSAAAVTLDNPPWLNIAGDDVLVYVLAGVRLDSGGLLSLVLQLKHSHGDCGSFGPRQPMSFPIIRI
jgi:hypothetical protein